jgi:hypothetical protein
MVDGTRESICLMVSSRTKLFVDKSSFCVRIIGAMSLPQNQRDVVQYQEYSATASEVIRFSQECYGAFRRGVCMQVQSNASSSEARQFGQEVMVDLGTMSIN